MLLQPSMVKSCTCRKYGFGWNARRLKTSCMVNFWLSNPIFLLETIVCASPSLVDRHDSTVLLFVGVSRGVAIAIVFADITYVFGMRAHTSRLPCSFQPTGGNGCSIPGILELPTAVAIDQTGSKYLYSVCLNFAVGAIFSVRAIDE